MRLVYEAAGRLPPTALRFVGRAQLRSDLLRRVIRSGMPTGTVVIRHGAAKGLRITAGEHSNLGYALGTTEPLVQGFLQERLRPGDVVYDIGANVGFFSLIAAKLVGPRGRVYAFEPLPANAAMLRRNIGLNGFDHVQVLEAAVAGATGEASLVIGESSLDGRLGAAVEGESSIVVPVTSLDDAMLDRAPTLVKIDAEGAEWEVLRGMRQLLTHRPTILCEVHRQAARDQHLAALAAALDEHAPGYELSLLEEGDDWWAPHVVAIPKG